jgi:hypothetical protein
LATISSESWTVCARTESTVSKRYSGLPDVGMMTVNLFMFPHGVVVEAAPFARPGAHLTRDFDDFVAWLATRIDKESIARLC